MNCISPWYSRKMQMSLPCGKCAFCIKKAINAWCLRLTHEMEVSSSAYFLTLTYNNEHLPENAELSKDDLQRYIKRIRKHQSGNNQSAIRYFAVGEYGTEGNRPHYHLVIFNLETLDLATSCWTDKAGNPMGYVVGSRANLGRIRYMVSYMALPQDVTHKQPPFRLMSRNPGLGLNYVISKKGTTSGNSPP